MNLMMDRLSVYQFRESGNALCSQGSCYEIVSLIKMQSFSAFLGKKAVVKRWTPEEISAVEKHLKRFLVRQDVPGKADCERCISAEPQALQQRDWKAVKYFIKNRITSMRRKLE